VKLTKVKLVIEIQYDEQLVASPSLSSSHMERLPGPSFPGEAEMRLPPIPNLAR
jgi:hypothetical protein